MEPIVSPQNILFDKSVENLSNKQTASTSPPLAFATPEVSPCLAFHRKRERLANESPPLLKRQRKTPSVYTSDSNADESSFNTNLPYLDCVSCSDGFDGAHGSSTMSLPLPSVTLHLRTKRSRIGVFVSSSSPEQDHDRMRFCDYLESRTCEDHGETNEDIDETSKNLITSRLQRASSSKSVTVLSRSPSTNMTRSLSMQLNLSLLNLATAATSSTSIDGCPLTASTSSFMPKRKSLLNISRSTSSAQDIQNVDGGLRRSPVAATLDYLATAIRFPDAIGLSI